MRVAAAEVGLVEVVAPTPKLRASGEEGLRTKGPQQCARSWTACSALWQLSLFFRNLRKPFPGFCWEKKKRRERVLMNEKAKEEVERHCHPRPCWAAEDAFSATLPFLNEDEGWGKGRIVQGKDRTKTAEEGVQQGTVN